MDARTSSFPCQPRVLIVDDTAVVRNVLGDIIAENGFLPLFAVDGKSCLEVAKRERPDLILLDIQLPDEDGFSVIKALKQDAVTRGIPVIFLTGQDNLEAKMQGFELGAVDFITKPFYLTEVQARLRVHLKLSFTMNALVRAQQERLTLVETAHRALLVVPSEVPGANFAVRIHQRQEAGGDYYDVLPLLLGQHGYFVADIAGHDLSTGFVTPAIKALLRQNCTPAYSPMDSMVLLNKVLVGMLEPGKFLTGIYLVLDRIHRRATLIGMGHLPVILRRASGAIDLYADPGDVIGAFEDVLFSERVIDVTPGDRFYLFSDGLIEGGGIANLWVTGIEPLVSAVRELPKTQSPAADIDAILRRFNIDLKGCTDDILLLCVEV